MSETRQLKVVIAGDAKSARAALKILGVGLDEADKKAKKTEESVRDVGDGVDDLGDDALKATAKVATFDAEISRLNAELRRLDGEFKRTGNVDSLKRFRQISAELTRIGKARKDLDGFNLTKFNDSAKTAQSVLSRLGDQFSNVAKNAVTATVNLSTNLFNLIIPATIAIVALNSAFTLLAPVVLIAGGAMGSAATAAVGLGAVFFTLKLGLGGLSDAFSELSKDGEVSAETMAKLSLNGQRFVKSVQELKKPFGDLKKLIQDKLLDNMNNTFKELALKWLPAAKTILGGMAETLNKIATKAMKALGADSFIDNMKAGADGFRFMLGMIGESIPGLIDAFGRLAKASVPFLVTVGDLLAGAIDKFSTWIKKADESGALTKFMQDAAKAMRDIWTTGGLVAKIIGDIIEILMPGSKRQGENFFERVNRGLGRLHDWLSNPENQQKIQDFITKVQDFADKVTNEWIPKALEWMNRVDGWVGKVEGWGNSIQRFKDNVVNAWNELQSGTIGPIESIKTMFESLPGKVQNALQALPGVVTGIIREALNRAASITGEGIGTVLGFFIMLPGRVLGALIALPSVIVNIFNSSRGQAGGIMSNLVSDVGRILSAIPGVAARAVGNLGAILVEAGRSLIGGLIRGIESQIPGLEAVLRRITALIPKNKGPIELDRVLLKPAGAAIMGGLVKGLDAGIPAVKGRLSRLPYDISSGGDSLATRSLGGASGAAGVNVTVNVAGTVTAERDLAKAIALTVRDEIVRNGRRNGGKTGLA